METPPGSASTLNLGANRNALARRRSAVINATRTCSTSECRADYYTAGYCKRHYQQKRRYRGPYLQYRRHGSICVVDGCGRAYAENAGRGMCSMHYNRWRRTGKTDRNQTLLSSRPCSAESCDRQQGQSGAKGLCAKHYAQSRYVSKPRAKRTTPPAPRVRKPSKPPSAEYSRESNRRSRQRYGLRSDEELTEAFLRKWPSGSKPCVRCREVLPRESFGVDKQRPDGTRRRCRQNGCFTAHAQEVKKRRLIASLERRGLPTDRCAYCLSGPIENADHFWPLARGGVDAVENMVGACWTCNRDKWHHEPHAWLRSSHPDRAEFFRSIFPTHDALCERP